MATGWSVKCLAIYLLECCLARYAKNNSIPSHNPTILVVRFARVRLLFPSLFGRLLLPRSFLSDGRCLCHDSVVNLDKL